MIYTLNGKTLNLKQWAEQPEVKQLGITYTMIVQRLRALWSFEQVVTTPKQSKGGKRAGSMYWGTITPSEAKMERMRKENWG